MTPRRGGNRQMITIRDCSAPIGRDAGRKVEWGNWGLTLIDTDNTFYQVLFPVGSQGPIEHPRDRWLAIADAWIERGERPARALKDSRERV